MAVAARVQEQLSKQGVEYRLVPHPRTGSTRESASESHVAEDHIAKGWWSRVTAAMCWW